MAANLQSWSVRVQVPHASGKVQISQIPRLPNTLIKRAGQAWEGLEGCLKGPSAQGLETHLLERQLCRINALTVGSFCKPLH